MSNFILSDFYTNLHLYNSLEAFKRDNPDKMKFPFTIKCIRGNFPFSFWNGDKNTNLDPTIMTYDDIIKFSQNNMIPFCFDFSNLSLTNEDILYDNHIKMLLKIFENQGHYLRISNPDFIPLIKNIYSGYYFILSELISPYIDYKSINDIQLIEQPFQLNALQESNNEKNIIITLGHPCAHCTYEQYLECIKQEQNYQINFSNQSILNNCDRLDYSTDIFTELQLQQKLGYQNFYIEETDRDFIVEFFIKSEFIIDFYKFYRSF